MASHFVVRERRASGSRFKVRLGSKTVADLGPHPGVPQALAAHEVELATLTTKLRALEDANLAADHAADEHGAKRPRAYWPNTRRIRELRRRVARLDAKLATLRALPAVTYHAPPSMPKPVKPLRPPTAAERQRVAELFLRSATRTGLQLPPGLPRRDYDLLGVLLSELARDGYAALGRWEGLRAPRRRA